MHVVLLEFALFAVMMTVAVLSGGQWYPNLIAERPFAKTCVAVLTIAATVAFLFQILGWALNQLQQLNVEVARPSNLVDEATAETPKWEARLQGELRRLGCYGGGIDGVWGEQSRNALSDFLTAVGKYNEYGDTVPVDDAVRLMSSSPDRVCTTSTVLKSETSMRKYKAAYNLHLLSCTKRFLGIPIEDGSQECRVLLANREKYARQLEDLGITPPGSR